MAVSGTDTTYESVPVMTWESLTQSSDCLISGQLNYWKDPTKGGFLSYLVTNKKKVYAGIARGVFYAFEKEAQKQPTFAFDIAGSSTKEYVGEKARPKDHIFEVKCAEKPTFYFGPETDDKHKEWIEVFNQQAIAADLKYSQNGHGYVLMIINFTGALTGYEKDRQALKSFFSIIGYDVQVAENCTRDQMFGEITRFKKHILDSPKDMKSVVVAVLSHGDVDGIMSCANPEGKNIEMQGSVLAKTPVEEIITEFKHDDDLNYKFKGIPKLFIIQACHGLNTVRSANQKDNVELMKNVIPKIPLAPVPVDADILIVYASTRNNQAFVRESQGSWFIQEMVRVFEKNYTSTDVEKMLREVTKSVADMKGKAFDTATGAFQTAAQIPSRASTLRNDFYL